ncbi:DUF2635 domain-containing protein [Rodentibacter myodis]|uniref:DUF2635 domain-containing protein n=1 Tax=Rodentibacter myodis TaxID=1907939 RepID=A0A1V3JSK9_9PAST|nr:DUF2635 domain-containing protein [Rodentibacter myodis]OOF59293.1 DUF2635 domain-containing protein [Rodentibacter myodis]
MKVKAKAGVKVPMEYHPFAYIEQTPVDVEPSVYYQRRIQDGDLVVVSDRSRKQEKNNE